MNLVAYNRVSPSFRFFSMRLRTKETVYACSILFNAPLCKASALHTIRDGVFFDVRDNLATFIKFLLTFRVNFWLNAPGLTLLLPMCFPSLCIIISGTLCSRSLLAILLIGGVHFAAPALFCRGLRAVLLTH